MANEFKIKNGLVTPTLQATDTTDSTLSTNGAAVFSGGVGIVKNLNVGGNLSVAGSFNPASINNAQIGNTTPNTGAFTTLTANAAVTFTQNTGSVNATSGTLVVTGGVGISENLNVGGNITVTGDLTVNGTTTTLNTETLDVEDKNIILGNITSPTDGTADGGGITLRGATNKIIQWLNATNRWTFNTGIEATSIQNTPVGTTTRSTGAFTSLTSNGATTFTAGTASVDTSTGTVVITGGLGVSGRINAANFDGVVGANAAAAGSFTSLSASGVVSVNTTGNNQNYTTSGAGVITISSGTTGTINNMSIGATTRSTGAFTTLAANGATTLTAGTNSASSTAGGTLTVTGGAAVSQDLYVGGDGFFGQAPNFTPNNTNLITAGDVNSFFQIAVQNKNAGATATGDVVVFANNGDDTSGWIDMGITSSGYNDPTYSLSGPGDGYLYVNGKTSGVGALVISTYTAKDIIFSTNGGAAANEVGRWKHGQGLTIPTSVDNTGIGTGALQVTNGGAYIAGNLYVGGTINLSGVAVQQIGQITTTAAGWNLP